MEGVARRWQLGGAVWILCHSLSACGGLEGARYTLDGVGTFSEAAPPDANMTLALSGSWSDRREIDLSGGSPSFSVAGIPVGPWTATSNPYSYSFQVVVEVDVPEGGDAPVSASARITRPSDACSVVGTGGAHERGDVEDGWVPVHLIAAFDFTSCW
jgi:hypothetical protein